MLGGAIGLAPAGAGPAAAEGAPPAEAIAAQPTPAATGTSEPETGAGIEAQPGPFGDFPELVGALASGGAAMGLAMEGAQGGGFAMPFPELFGGTEVSEEAQPEASNQAEGQAIEPEEDDDEEDGSATGARHVDERDLIASVHRRLLVERERMGGFGALIR